MATREPRALKPDFREPVKRKRGEVAEPEQPSQEQIDELARQRDAIEAIVAEYVREAVSARETSGIEELWQDSEDAYNGVDEITGHNNIVKTRDQAVGNKASTSARSTVILNITKPKTDVGVSRVQEILVPTDEKPWGFKPTPIPDLDPSKIPPNKRVRLGDGTVASAQTFAQMLRDQASEAAKAAEDWVEDRFVEGSVYAEMRQVIQDAGRIGTGVLKGPYPMGKKVRKWHFDRRTGELRLEKGVKVQPTSRRVRAQDCYPDPACGENVHNGSYFVERDFLSKRKMRELGNDPAYDRRALAEVIQAGPTRGVKNWRDRTANLTPGETTQDASMFEVFYVYCDLEPAEMLLLGVAPEKLKPEEFGLQAIPAVVTVVNGRCIKCVINPDETGEFPFDFFRWDKVAGQPWGRGIPYKMHVAQKGVTASTRAMLENGGVSSGPQIAFVKGKLRPLNGRYEIVGRKLWEAELDEAMDDIRKAFATFDVPSHTQELLEMIQFFLNMADQLTNLPMLLQGEQAAGTSPETLGGMKLLVQNASSPLRVIAKQFDDDLIVPHLRRYYDACMQAPDAPKEAKEGDSQVFAKGSAVLVQREEAREFLMMLFAVKDDPNLRIDPAKYIEALGRANGFSMQLIQYTTEEWEKMQAEAPPPPKDPRVEAAEIRNQGLQQQAQLKAQDAAAQREFDAQQAAEDRALQAFLARVEENIQVMELAGDQQISINDIKAMLAKEAMANRTKRDEMALKLAPANESGLGI